MIPETFGIGAPVPGLDVHVKMVTNEVENVEIAGSDSYRRSRISDEERGHFPPQVQVKPARRYPFIRTDLKKAGGFKRFGHTTSYKWRTTSND